MIFQRLAAFDTLPTSIEFNEKAKALDRDPFQVLLHKLRLFGPDENLICFDESYHSDRCQFVIVEKQMSDHPPVLSGVPPGSVLSPLLNIIFLKDMLSIFPDAFLWLFAYDLTFISLNFEADLLRLYSWNLASGMLSNVVTTKIVALRADLSVFLSNEHTEVVEHQKVIGILLG